MTNSEYHIYILFSATPYRIGSWIRHVTGEPYNHVAIATDGNLRAMYSFARRYYHAPFYGGFVTETPCRYHHNNATSQIRLYRLPLNREQWKMLNRILKDMRKHSEHYLYNHLSAMAAPLHWKIPVKDAYTCAEFTVSLLSALGFPFDPDKFYTLHDIAAPLEPYLLYTGGFPEVETKDRSFFDRSKAAHPLFLSARDFFRLFPRLSLL